MVKSMNKLVVLTGSGISAESGISTFRDAGGLWEKHKIEDVATPQAFARNPKKVLEFYNARRKQLKEVKPNDAHYTLVELEKYFHVTIITQNVDNLHERAGSKNIIHLHGELKKVRSTGKSNVLYNWEDDLHMGDQCEFGYQLRPHIVWFGEDVPMISTAVEIVQKADVFAVVGTSLEVYPAAGLAEYVEQSVPKYIVDPYTPVSANGFGWQIIKENAGTGVKKMATLMIANFS